MQKIIIGTIAFALTGIILAYAAFESNEKLNQTPQITEGVAIESGAMLYQTHCANCHGINGRAEECFDQSGTKIACTEAALNSRDLFCYQYRSFDDRRFSTSLSTWGYIKHTTRVGSTNEMPAFAKEYGGNLSELQIEHISSFVMNWEYRGLYGCHPTPTPNRWPSKTAELPPGDEQQGEYYYNIGYGCAACHGDMEEEGSNAVGPWLGKFRQQSFSRTLPEEGVYTTADYIYESILFPSAHIATNCPTGPCSGPPSSMPDNFSTRMYPKDMANIMSYLFGTTSFTGNIDFAEKYADHPELWQAYAE